MISSISTPARLLRPKEAHQYVGMSRTLFVELVRPYVQEIKLGNKSIAYDRLDLDEWINQYKKAGCDLTKIESTMENRLCINTTQKPLASSKEARSGGSAKGLKERQVADFKKALGHQTMTKPNDT